jgi:DNA-binding LacI/PurR family transcriptional regulator
MICGAPDDHAAALRVAGFRAAAVRQGLGTDAAAVAFAGHQPMYGLLRRVLSAGPTALFVADEALALEASHILRDLLDLRVPEHVSLLGMESAEMSRLLAMTTLAQPLEELARAALDLLLRQVETRDPAPEHVVLPCRLIERDSVTTATVVPPSRRPSLTEHVALVS